MKKPELALVAAAALLGASLSQSAFADDSKTVGRVRVTTLRSAKDGSAALVNAALDARYAPAAGK